MAQYKIEMTVDGARRESVEKNAPNYRAPKAEHGTISLADLTPKPEAKPELAGVSA